MLGTKEEAQTVVPLGPLNDTFEDGSGVQTRPASSLFMESPDVEADRLLRELKDAQALPHGDQDHIAVINAGEARHGTAINPRSLSVEPWHVQGIHRHALQAALEIREEDLRGIGNGRGVALYRAHILLAEKLFV